MGILGIKNVTETKKRLDQADQNSALVSDGRQNRRNTVVNESGLYDVCDVLGLRTDKARERLNSEDKGIHTVDTPGGRKHKNRLDQLRVDTIDPENSRG